MSMYNLAFQLPFIPGFAACSPLLSLRLHKLTVFVELVTGIPSRDTRNLSIGSTAIPLIRVPRARIDLATLSSKWVQGVRQYESAGMQGIMASNHFPIMQDVP